MISNKDYSSILLGSITSRETQIRPKNKELRSYREEWDIKQLLSMLPKKKASANFDRKMAAAFSLELEREVRENNAAIINEKSH
ncbi:MAG TPA: hypothetical protein VKM37_01170 [Balneolaceae bacterium]|nr:hypothetical protein [Balneolaceae bacterium]